MQNVELNPAESDVGTVIDELLDQATAALRETTGRNAIALAVAKDGLPARRAPGGKLPDRDARAGADPIGRCCLFAVVLGDARVTADAATPPAHR